MNHKQVKSFQCIYNVNGTNDGGEKNDCSNCNNNIVINKNSTNNNNNINWYRKDNGTKTGNNKKPVNISDKRAQTDVFLGNAVNRINFFTFYNKNINIFYNGLVILVLFNTICVCAASVNRININNIDNNFGE